MIDEDTAFRGDGVDHAAVTAIESESAYRSDGDIPPGIHTRTVDHGERHVFLPGGEHDAVAAE